MSSNAHNHIVFILDNLSNWQTLQAGVPAGTEVHVIDSQGDALAQMAAVLQGRQGVEAIHLMSHGSAGSLNLGRNTLSSANLGNYSSEWASVRAALSDDADFLIYGCDVAAGDAGQAFVAQLAELTGADIAASEDITGAAVLGGDWDLETHVGQVDRPILAITEYQALLPTIAPSANKQTITGSTISVSGGPTDGNFTLFLSAMSGYSASNYNLLIGVSKSNIGAPSLIAIKDNQSLDSTNVTLGSISTSYWIEGIWDTPDTYEYTIRYDTDGIFTTGNESLSIVTVVVENPNTAPDATGSNLGIKTENATVSVNLSALTSDGETASTALTYSITSGVSGGNLSGYTYTFTTPQNAALKGDVTDSFTYAVSDGELSDSATVGYTVRYADDPTVWNSPPSGATWNTSGSKSYAWNSGASDPDDTVSYSFLSVNGGTPSWMSTDTTISGNPGASFANTTYTINVRATGSTNADRSFTITLGTAEQLNDAPTTSGYSKTINEDAAYTFVATDFPFTDTDSGSLYNTRHSIKITSLPANATLKLDNADVSTNQVIAVADIPKLVVTPTAQYNGSTNFGFQVFDGLAWSSTATMTLNVTAVNDAPVLTDTGSDMTGITEDATSNGGQLVSALLATLTDVDTSIGSTTHGSTNGRLQGVAIYNTTVNGPSTGGKWQYKIDTGSWTDFGTVSEAQALLLKSTDSIRFLPDGKNGQTASFDYYGWDQATGAASNKVSVATRGGTTAFSTAGDSVAITVDDVNDAPTIAKPAAQTVNEDASIGISGISFGDVDIVDRNDSDTANDNITAALSVSHGILTLAGTTDITVDAGADGSASMTISGTLAAINTAVATLTYAPNGNYSGSDTLNIGVDDKGNVGTGGALTASTTLGITVTPVNDAPVLIDGVPQLTTRTENDTTNAGNLVSDLLGGTTGGSTNGDKTGRTDVDTLNNGGLGNAPEAVGQGIAIYATSNSGPADGGTWQYSTDGGSNWTAIGSVSSSSALLLAATDKVRFVPDSDNATSASISFYAWDQATGTRGTKVDPGARGGSTAFSLGTDTATISVTPVNDAPTLDLDLSAVGTGYSTTFLPRGNEVAIVDTDITIRDVDQTANPNTDAIHAGQDRISQAVITLSSGADDNYPGQIDETLTFKNDGVATTTWNGLTITGNASTAVTITGVATWETYQSALQKVVYNNANLNPTTGNRTVTVVVTDNDDTGTQSNKLVSATATTTITVPGIAVLDMNGNLTGSDHTVSYTEGDAGRMLSSTDGRIDNLGGNNLKTVVLTLSNPLDGTAGNAESLFVDTATINSLATDRGITVTGSGTHTVTLTATNAGTGVTANAMNVALRAVQYKNTSEAPNVTPRVVNVTVEDIVMAGAPAKTTLNIVPVNDAPIISTNTAHTLLEGGLLTLSTANLNATDVDDVQATLDFVVTTAPTKGVLFRDANGNNLADSGEVLAASAATGVITSFSQGDIAAGLVKYQQTDTAANSATDYGSDSFAFKVQDGMENGVVAPTGTHTLTITPVNDAPTLTATASNPTFAETSGTAVGLFSAAAASAIESSQSITELKLTVSGLGNGADEKLKVDGVTLALQAIGTTPITGGTLGGISYGVAISGSTATVTLTHAGLSTSQAQELINGLAYQNSSNAPSGTNRVVTLTAIKDSGGTSNGGIDTTVLSICLHRQHQRQRQRPHARYQHRGHGSQRRLARLERHPARGQRHRHPRCQPCLHHHHCHHWRHTV